MFTHARFNGLVLLAGVAAVAAQDACPPVTDIDSSWPMSRILKDVCKKGGPHDGGVDCSSIPGLLDTLKELSPDIADQFENAKIALNFFCDDKCVGPIREGVTYLGDKHPQERITSSGAHAVCSASGCMDKYKSVAQSFASRGAVGYQSEIEASCKKGKDSDAAKHMEDMMNSMMGALDRVRDVANQLMFEKAEAKASPLSARAGRPGALRLAAYGCLAVGAALLVAAAVVHVRSRSPTSFKELEEKDTEML